MPRIIRILFVMFTVLASPASAQLFLYVGDALDAAAYERGIAPESVFVVKGSFPLPSGLRVSTLPLRDSLNGVSVLLTSKAAPDAPTLRALILYTFADFQQALMQVAAVLPSGVAPGDYTLSVVSGSVTATGGRARVVARKFRLLTNNQEGYGLAASQVSAGENRYHRNMFVAGRLSDGQTKAPAHAGEVMVLWGLGLGSIDQSARNVRVRVGGVDAAVLYAGRAPAYPGIDQINFVVPPDAPTGCQVALEVTVEGAASNPVTAAIASPGADACAHAMLTRDQLEALDQGRSWPAGEFTLNQYREPDGSGKPVEIHSAIGYFSDLTASRASRLDVNSIAPGRCTVFAGDPSPEGPGRASWLLLDSGADDYNTIDAGPVTAHGASLPGVLLNGDDDYYYRMFSALREDTGELLGGTAGHRLTAGRLALRSAGGSDAQAFEAAVDVPAPLRWTGWTPLAEVDRAAELTLRWTREEVRDRVFVQGVSGDEDSIETFICLAAEGANALTIPVSVLATLRDGPGILRVASFGPRTGARFTVRNKAAEEIGPNALSYLFMTTQVVTWRRR